MKPTGHRPRRDVRPQAIRFGLGRAVVAAPAMLGSLLLLTLASVTLGRWVGLLLPLAWAAAAAALMTRVGEQMTLRAAFGFHRPVPAQAASLKPAWSAALAVTGTAPGDVELYIQTARAPNAYAAGGRSVAVTSRIVEDHATGRLPEGQLVAVLVHELGHHATGATRSMLILSWLSAPWRLARSLLSGLASTLAASRTQRRVVPLVAGVAVVATRAAAQGQWVSGGVLVFVGLAAVLCPLANAVISRRVEYAADRFAADCGLAAHSSTLASSCSLDLEAAAAQSKSRSLAGVRGQTFTPEVEGASTAVPGRAKSGVSFVERPDTSVATQAVPQPSGRRRGRCMSNAEQKGTNCPHRARGRPPRVAGDTVDIQRSQGVGPGIGMRMDGASRVDAMRAGGVQREVLGEAECRRRLTEVSIGHVAFSAQALPAIQPVFFAVHDGQVVFPAPTGSGLVEACRGAVVAVGADDHRASGAAWSVTVVGAARVVTDADEVAALDGLGLGSWPVATSRCYIAVDMGVVTGWRVRGAAASIDGMAGQEGAPARA